MRRRVPTSRRDMETESSPETLGITPHAPHPIRQQTSHTIACSVSHLSPTLFFIQELTNNPVWWCESCFLTDERVRRIPVQTGSGATPTLWTGCCSCWSRWTRDQTTARVGVADRRVLRDSFYASPRPTTPPPSHQQHELCVHANSAGYARRGRRVPQATPLGGHYVQYTETGPGERRDAGSSETRGAWWDCVLRVALQPTPHEPAYRKIRKVTTTTPATAYASNDKPHDPVQRQ